LLEDIDNIKIKQSLFQFIEHPSYHLDT